MTVAAVLDRPVEASQDEDDNVVHTYCCDKNLSLCGLDITDAEEVDEENQAFLDCLFCDAIVGNQVHWTCPRCGRVA